MIYKSLSLILPPPPLFIVSHVVHYKPDFFFFLLERMTATVFFIANKILTSGNERYISGKASLVWVENELWTK